MKLIRFIKSISMSLVVMLAIAGNLFGMETKKHEITHKEFKAHRAHEMVTPHTIARDCTNKDFVFLDAYEQLPKRGKRGPLRQQALTLLDKKAQEIAEDKDAETIFKDLPEGYLKMKVREIYYNKHGKKIDGDWGPKIKEIMQAINGAPKVTLGSVFITSFDGIADLLVIKNEENPIKELKISNNDNLRKISIPAALTALQSLWLDSNEYVEEVDIPDTLTALKELVVSNQSGIRSIPGTLTALTDLSITYTEVKEVKIPATLTALKSVWLDSNQLTTVSIPETLTALEFLSLNHNKQLETVNIPEAVSKDLELKLEDTKLSKEDRELLKARFKNISFYN